MKDENAQQLLAKVMHWKDTDTVLANVPLLRLLADYKYDHYQRFGPGKRFIESLALWLEQFDDADREMALKFILTHLVFISDPEISHLVQHAYLDVIVNERLKMVAEERGIAGYRVAEIARDERFGQLQHKSLYLGLSDGARTNELRRASNGEISNEQIWQAYELGEAKAEDMLAALAKALSPEPINSGVIASNDAIWNAFESGGRPAGELLLETWKHEQNKASPAHPTEKFRLIWLLDDFSGSGNTYIRFDGKSNRFKGKIKKIYERLNRGDLVDTTHYEVFLLLYIATRQAIDHIEYWSERFTSEFGYKPLQLRVLCPVEKDVSLNAPQLGELNPLFLRGKYYDHDAFDEHIAVGGTKDAQMGFAGCALPIVLAHNTPNNSVYVLWGPESSKFCGLFPRVSRHKDF